MSIGGIGPCEPIEMTDGDSPGNIPQNCGPVIKWWEATLLFSSLAAVVIGSVLLTAGAGGVPPRALFGFCLLFGGMGIGVLVEARRHRRIRQAVKNSHTS